jgi:GntR family transcriptional regulator, histidine utilization repressor
MLKVTVGAPCLVIERRTWSGETPVTHVKLTYPGEAHELIARFTPGKAS